ncbi:NAD-dependent epimerase/dehydratase family protein [Bacillus sp. S14(2024)]|uniref:NAD-dependent epimerase/dehydratase family protein n=1 Tax=Bacillus sp. S14(2024) TaxID=3162884 RepID=UPI003D22F12C
MKRVIVVGALTFIGYHLVQKFLEEEVEVYALDFDDMKSVSKVSEEKLCLIGRNALFTYFSLRDDEGWEVLEKTDIDAAYFCLCEPNQQKDFRNERIILQYVKRFESFCRRKEIKFIVLSSVEVGHACSNENNILFSKIEREVKKGSADYCILRVPTVYGPWQPLFMAYHHVILSQMKQQTISVPVEECTCDLIYVEDVARCLYELGQKRMERKIYSLCSGKENQWQKGIELLQETGKIQIHHKECQKNEETEMIVTNPIALEDGLQRQISHIKHYKELYEGSGTW